MDKNFNNINKSPNNNIIALKRASSQISSFISGYENDMRNNKTLNIDNKRDYLIKNKFFFSSSELGNITDILNKKELTMSENKLYDDINNIKIKDINKNKDIIKVNTKIFKNGSSRANSQMTYNNSKSNSKSKIHLNNININKNKNKLFNTLHKKVKENNIKNIKYNISNTQKKFFINEKFNFLIRKLNKIFLGKIFIMIKKRYKYKFDRFRKNSNFKKSYDKTNSKILNLSSKKQSKTKNKENKNNINSNIFKQTYNNKNIGEPIGINGLNRSPSKISVKDSDNYKINQHQTHIQHKQRSVNIKLNQNMTTNNFKIKKNKTYNDNKSKSKDKKNNQNNNILQKKMNNKKCNSYKKELKKNTNNNSKDKSYLKINNSDKELMKILASSNYNNIKQNEDIYYYNTEISTSLINKIYNMNNSGRICKVYENCLIEGNKYYQPKIGGSGPKYKNDNLIHPSPTKNIKSDLNSPFLKKNVSLKKTSPKKDDKRSLNFKVSNFNERYNIYDKNINYLKYETNPINNNNLCNLFNYEVTLKNIFYYWSDYSIKKKIMQKILNKNKIFELIKKSKNIIFKRLLKTINICIINKYFNKYKNIYYKGKILQHLKYFKHKVIKCINIPINQKNRYDIINNININNYINCSDLNKIMKKRSQSPVIISKLIMSSKGNENNNNLKEIKNIGNIFDNQNRNISDIKCNLKNYYNDDFIQFAQTDRIKENFNLNIPSKKTVNQKIISLNGLNINQKKNKNNINNTNLSSEHNKSEMNIKKNNLINQVNQLRMVFNLLEQHENENNNLYNCFHKWSYETNIYLRNNNKNLFWSFSGNNNSNIDVNSNKKEYNKYSVNTYKEKDVNNTCFGKKIFEIGKYTPVRGIKNFRSKTSQKMPNNPKVLDYNDLDDINKQLNFDIFNNKSSSSLMNIKYINKNDMNIVYHKKKLITPNLQSNYNNCFLEYNNSCMTNYDNFKSMNLTSMNFYKNDFIKSKYNLYNSNINISNNELNTSINSYYKDNYNIGNMMINPYKSYTYFQPKIIQEKKIDLKKINRIEEKEINFALYKRNTSYEKSPKINNININNSKNEQNNKIAENNKLIYKKGKNAFMNNISNKKICIYSYSNKSKEEKNKQKKISGNKKNKKEGNISANYGKCNCLESEFMKDKKKGNIKYNFSFSYFENKSSI